MAFQRRQTTSAGSLHTGNGNTYEWVKLVRKGDVVEGYTSPDGENWIYLGRDTLPDFPETIYVGMAATDNAGSNHVTATVQDLSFRPLSAAEVIPAAQLASLATDANDLDSDNLPDDWEAQFGLDPANALETSGEYGDFDHDGINNITEYQLGSNPAQRESMLDGLTRDRWEEVHGMRVTDLTSNRGRFLRQPNEVLHVENIDENSHGNNYASRYRGFITAPAAGDYTFWIAGDNEAELWLSDGTVVKDLDGVSTPLTNRYGKQKLAWIQDQRFGSDFTSDEDFDRFATQRTRTVHLELGQHYYIEVLHKESGGGDHIAVAWQSPGGQREIIPSSVFSSDLPELDDADADFLPAAWEAQYGLNPADSGISDARDGQYGDWDQDGLNNFEEYKLGTDPTNSDSDGDSLSDKEERDYYGSDPLVNNALATNLHTEVTLGDFQSSSNAWESDGNGSLTSTERRGYIDYPFTVADGEEGIFEICMSGGAAGVIRSVEELPLEISINDEIIGQVKLRSENGASTALKHLTPWLNAGSYTLRIRNTNYRAMLKLRLDSVEVYRLGGVDLDDDGVADWVETKLSEENFVVRAPEFSFTSPASVEGGTSSLASFILTKSVISEQGETTQLDQEVLAGINGGFFSDVTLNEQGSTTLSFDFQNAALTETRTITWKATNILTQDALVIRKGDSLRLAAFGEGESQTGSFTLSQNGQPVVFEGGDSLHFSAHVVNFATAGDHAFEATWQPADGSQPWTSSLVVTVKDADFGDTFDILAWNRRSWTIPGVSSDFDVSADDALSWTESTVEGQTDRSFVVDSYEAIDRHVLARVPETGEIIARGTVSGFHVAGVDETNDAQLVSVAEDGTRRYRYTVVAEGLPEDGYIVLRNHYQGTAFLDGGNELILTAADFNTNGIADVYVEWGGDGSGKLCHTLNVFLNE